MYIKIWIVKNYTLFNFELNTFKIWCFSFKFLFINICNNIMSSSQTKSLKVLLNPRLEAGEITWNKDIAKYVSSPNQIQRFTCESLVRPSI